MSIIKQAEAEFRKIWPHGPECAHAYAAAGFHALAKAREEMERITKERNALRKAMLTALSATRATVDETTSTEFL